MTGHSPHANFFPPWKVSNRFWLFSFIVLAVCSLQDGKADTGMHTTGADSAGLNHLLCGKILNFTVFLSHRPQTDRIFISSALENILITSVYLIKSLFKISISPLSFTNCLERLWIQETHPSKRVSIFRIPPVKL